MTEGVAESRGETVMEKSSAVEKLLERETDPYDPLGEIAARLANPPKMWTPRGVPDGVDADKCLTIAAVSGMVQSIEDRDDEYGGHKVIVVRAADGSRISVAGFGTILHDLFERVSVGDAIGLEYEGEVTPKTPGYKDYPMYRVEWIPAARKLEAVPAEDELEDSDLPLNAE
jgi:hypothetical protein